MKLNAQVKKFVALFGSNKRYCYSSGQKSMVNTTDLDEALQSNNTSDVYFYVNDGGTKQHQMRYLIGNFLDIDAGRNAAGKYLTRFQVRLRKLKMLEAINTCPLAPSIVVETRNGYQLYWIYEKALVNTRYTLADWNNLQRRICDYFNDVGGDYRALKVNQVFRVPGTYWRKKYEGVKDTFYTSVLKRKFKKYTPNAIKAAFFNPLHDKVVKSVKTTHKTKIKVGSPTGWDTVYNKKDAKTGYIIPENRDTECDVKAFLRDVAQVLFLKKMSYLSQIAWKLYNTFDLRYKERK
jgi:hypothetical protein